MLRIAKPGGVPEFWGWSGEALPVCGEEYESRLSRVRVAMAKEDSLFDVLVVKSPEDVRFLTGFHTIGDSPPQSLIIPREGKPFMVARLMEVDLVQKYTWVEQVWTCPDAGDIHKTFCEALRRVLPGDAACTVGIPLDVISASYHGKLCDFFSSFPKVVLKDASRTVEDLRLEKSKFEQDLIQQASVMSEKASAASLQAVRKDVLLSDLHILALRELLAAGSEPPSYDPVVRTTDPSGHGSWEVGERVHEANLVFLEMAACVHGHHAPLMRTAYVMGPEETSPPQWLMEAEKLIQAAFDTCLPLMVPGARACDIDKAGRDILTSNTSGLTMAGRLGYTTGGTAINPAGNAGWGDADFSLVGHNTAVLREGMVFHFVPWFQKYVKPVTGPIGLSGTVLVTPDGGKRFGSLPLRLTIVRHDGSCWERSD